MLVEEDDKKFVKHHLFNFGSILGSASNMANSPRSGNQYLFTWRHTWRQIFSLVAFVPQWYRGNYKKGPAIGMFEWEIYRPDAWTPEYRNPTFKNRLPDDTYWAAKKVMAFSDDDLRAILGLAQYSDPEASDWLVTCLIKRCDKVDDFYLRRVLPLDHFGVDGDALTFEHLGAKYDLFEAPGLTFEWSRFDNSNEQHTPIDGAANAQLPTAVRDGTDGLYSAKLPGDDRQKTVTVFLRKNSGDYRAVGIDRTWPLP
jgi:hypothetical protein